MVKITFLGAGSTVFAKNVLGDVMLRECLHDAEIALYDIDGARLEESYLLITAFSPLKEAAEGVRVYANLQNLKYRE